MRDLMAKFPGADRAPSFLEDAIFRLAKEVDGALSEEVEGERKAGEAVGEDAVVNVAAGGEVAGQRRGFLPGLAAAARILVVVTGQRLPPGCRPSFSCRDSGSSAGKR